MAYSDTPPLPTMQDIATAAGVSKATVSLALRADARIPEATRLRIEALAQKLGYRPDPLLSALSARRGQQRASANIALLVDDAWGRPSQQPAWMKNCISGITATAQQLGYCCSQFRLKADLCIHTDPDRVLRSRGIRGLLILPFCGRRPQIPQLDWSQYPVVTVGDPMPEMGWHRVGSDAFAAMSVACEKLREQGQRRIALVQYLDTECRLRHELLGALLKEQQLHSEHQAALSPLFYTRSDLPQFLQWYRSERPQAIISNSEQVLDWLEAASIRIPEDVSVALLNSDSARRSNISGITQQLAEAGSAAMELLHTAVLRGHKGAPAIRREVLIAPRWQDGATTAAPTDAVAHNPRKQGSATTSAPAPHNRHKKDGATTAATTATCRPQTTPPRKARTKKTPPSP